MHESLQTAKVQYKSTESTIPVNPAYDAMSYHQAADGRGREMKWGRGGGKMGESREMKEDRREMGGPERRSIKYTRRGNGNGNGNPPYREDGRRDGRWLARGTGWAGRETVRRWEGNWVGGGYKRGARRENRKGGRQMRRRWGGKMYMYD